MLPVSLILFPSFVVRRAGVQTPETWMLQTLSQFTNAAYHFLFSCT